LGLIDDWGVDFIVEVDSLEWLLVVKVILSVVKVVDVEFTKLPLVDVVEISELVAAEDWIVSNR
jgi:hypothetical protein